MKGHSLIVFVLSLRAGGLGQFRGMGAADEGTGVRGRRHRKPLYRGHEPGYTDVQTNCYFQGNEGPTDHLFGFIHYIMLQPIKLLIDKV